MNKRMKTTLSVAAIATLTLAGCGTTTGERAATGGAIGAAGGAVGAAVIGAPVLGAAVLSGAAGAAVGALTESSKERD